MVVALALLDNYYFHINKEKKKKNFVPVTQKEKLSPKKRKIKYFFEKKRKITMYPIILIYF